MGVPRIADLQFILSHLKEITEWNVVLSSRGQASPAS